MRLIATGLLVAMAVAFLIARWLARASPSAGTPVASTEASISARNRSMS